ncbi:MAG: DUF937 domain-containing protein [Cytophagaceae bacterium]|nr:DUF937 domain-containing protein [Cytophagaceae bacterium]
MNLFGTLKDLITPEMRVKTALFVSENPEKTRLAFDTLLTTVAGGLMKRASTETGLDQLFRTLQKSEAERHLLENLPQVLDSPERTSQLAAHGNGLVSQLLPDKKSSMATMISTYAKVRNSSATNLMGLAMPMVLAVIRREVVDRNLDVQGLGGLLADQRETWLSTVPTGLSDKMFEVLGIDNWQEMDAAMRSSGVAAQRRANAVVPRTPTTKTAPVPIVEDLDDEARSDNWKRWALPVIALAVLGGGVFWYLNRPENAEPTQEPTLPTEQVTPVSDTLAQADSLSRPATTSATDSSVAAATSPAGGALTSQLTAYLQTAAAPGRTFELAGVAFAPATAQLVSGSDQSINELAGVMKKNPFMQVRLIGYATDSVNAKAISLKRATTVKSRLVASGIDLIRVDAAGLGKAANVNRIEVKIVKR